MGGGGEEEEEGRRWVEGTGKSSRVGGSPFPLCYMLKLCLVLFYL